MRTLAALFIASAAIAQPAATPTPSTPLAPAHTAPAAKSASKTPVYDEKADAKQQIAEALRHAAKENRRVLIQWGGNWCPWCIRLHQFYNSDQAIKKTLQYEYDMVFIDAGRPDDKNLDLATSYGADLKTNGFPFLTILDSRGKVLANQETSSLEAKNEKGESIGVDAGYDAAKVLKFFEDHKAAYENATEVLDHAIAQAKETHKTVFLHFGAPWCVWCRRLEAWMDRPEVAPVLAKYFIDCKIDEDRMIGGKDVESKYTAAKQTGIPVFFFLDSSGKTIANSMPGGQNIGFPSEAKEIAHFESMLKAAGVAQPDAQTLTNSLEAPTENSGH